MAIYRVQAPNGKIYTVEGPEGADQNTVFGFVQQQIDQEILAEERRRQTGIFGTFGSAAARGAGQVASTFTDIIPAAVGSALGFEDYARAQLKEAEEKQIAREAKYPTLFRSYKEIGGLGDFAQYATEAVGEQLANIGTSLIPGVGLGAGASAFVGRRAATAVAKEIAEEAAKKGLTGKAATEFELQRLKELAQTRIFDPKKVAQTYGQASGIYLGSYAQNAPEVFQNIFDETGELAPGAAALFGSVAAALDAILPSTLAKQLTGPAKIGIVEKVLEKSGMEKGLLRSLTAGTLQAVGTEGLTEGAQEAISIAAERFVDANPGVFGSKEWNRIVESAIKGAIAGGAFGGAGGGVEGLRARAETTRQKAVEAERDGKLEEAERLQQEADKAEAAYFEALNRQAEQEQAKQQQFEQYQQGLTQMQLPGMETSYGTIAPTPPVTEPQVKEPKFKQAEMFTAEGALTPQMEKAAAKDQKAAEKQQKEREAQFKKDQQELKTRLQKAAPAPTPVTLETIQKIEDPVAFGKLLSIGRTARILRADGPLAGADLSKPEDAARVKSALVAYASGKPAVGSAEKIEALLQRPEFQGAPDVARVDTQPSGEGVGVPVETVGGAAPAPVEPVERGGMDVAPSDVGQPAAGEVTQPSALETAPTEVAPEPAAPEADVFPSIDDLVGQVDAEVNTVLGSRAAEAYAEAGLDPELVANADYRNTEAHNTLRIPRLVAEYSGLKNNFGTPQEAVSRQRMAEIKNALNSISPDALNFLNQFEGLPATRQDAILSSLNQNVLNDFDSYVKSQITEVKAAETKKTTPEKKKRAAAPKVPTSRLGIMKAAYERAKPEVITPSVQLTDEEAFELLDNYAQKFERATGKKLFLPKYEGPVFDQTQRKLAEAGDVNGLLRNLLDSIQDPAIKQVLRRVRSLNLKTKLEIGDPRGELNLESPAFRAWFEDSKVVDAQDKPLVVYHGTGTVDFPTFDFGKIQRPFFGFGFHFSESPKLSNFYAEQHKRAAHNMPVYLSIKNPFVVNSTMMDDYYAVGRKADGSIMSDKEIANKLREQGYDGIKYIHHPTMDMNKEDSRVVWVAFAPNQIKSAIGNIGTYDPTNPNILYSPRAGSYDPITDTITLDPTNGLNAHTFIHETLHAAISNVLANENHPLTKQFQKFFISIQDRLGAAYGATDLQEFAAELISNPSFQAVLKTIKAPKSENMFVRIMRAIAEFFGFAETKVGKALLETTALNRGLKFINDAIDITNDVPATAAQRLFLGDGKNQSEYVESVAQAQPSLAGKTLEDTKNFLSNLSGSEVQRLAFGLLRLDNLRDLYRKELPSIKVLLDALERRVGVEEKAIEHASANFKKFIKVQKDHPAAMRVLNDLAIEISDAQVDVLADKFERRTIAPERLAKMTQRQKDEFDMVEDQRGRDYIELKEKFKPLPPEVKELYKTIRKDYDAAFNRYRAILEKAAEGSPAILAKLREEFTLKQPLIGYVPYRRFGDYWLEFTDPDTDAPVAMAFESIRERDEFAANELKGIPSQKYEKLENIIFNQNNIPPTHFLNNVINKLRSEGASDAQINSVYQAYLAAFPAESVAKQFIKRTGKRGMERDIVRGYNDLMVRWARKLANSEYIPQIDRALAQIAQEGQAFQRNSPNGAPDVGAAVRNIMSQSDFFHNPTYGAIVSGATQLSFFEFMAGNISSAIINLTSLPLMVFPILTGKFGWADVMPAMLEAGRIGMPTNDWSKVPKYKKLYETLDAHGQLKHTMAREVLEGRRQRSEDYTGRTARIMDALAIPFSVAERYNRSVTAIAAFNLAIKQGMSEQQAIDYTLETVKTAHTSGMAATGPRWMQAPLGRIFFTFKSFIWNSAYVLARAFHQAFKGESKEVRDAARRQLLATYGMATVFTGVKGMPFYGAMSVMAEMLNALFGDEDEPFDFDEFMRGIFGDFLYKGAFNYLTNLEVANRAGLATDLVFRDDPRGVAEHGYVLSAMQQAFGPIGAIAVNSGRAAQLFKDGQYERSLEAIAPSFVRNGVKGARFLREGALTLKGDPIDEDISAYNSLMQVVGFAPADLSNRYEMLQAAKGFEREVELRRREALRLYDMAIRAGDGELLEEVRDRIQSFNEKHPKYRITQDSLRRSIKAREAAEKDMIYGVRFNKNLRGEIIDKFFEGEFAGGGASGSF